MNLARQYEQLRRDLPSGSERTGQMEQVIAEMRARASEAKHILPELAASRSPGQRLAAVAILNVMPDPEHIKWLGERMEAEKPFIGYHAARALLAAAQHLDPAYHEQIRAAIQTARQALWTGSENTDRGQMLNAVENALRSVSPGTAGLALMPVAFDAITLDERGRGVERRRKHARQFIEPLTADVALAMVEIPGGTFLMGAPESEEGFQDSEGPEHKVTVAPFYMGRIAVTQAQWRAVAELPAITRRLHQQPVTVSGFAGADLPVTNICRDDAIEFCARLSQKTGRHYRLPSEAEWEYACRAGTGTAFAFGETISTKYVNFDGRHPYARAAAEECRGVTVPAGSLGEAANDFGLFDMHGNVWEWIADAWHGNYNGAPADGGAWVKDGNDAWEVLRGGAYDSQARACRSAYRNYVARGTSSINYGFRVAVSLAETKQSAS
ncbi:MAG: formylglycine-generating enzyme family protein [Blastocatellia bacterium]